MTDQREPPPTRPSQPTRRLLTAPVRVVNIGLASFAADLHARAIPVVHVDWSTARIPDPRLAALLARLGT